MNKKIIAIIIFILVFVAGAYAVNASTSTDENLTLNGTFQFTTSPTAGYVLTSDGTGLASWAAITNYWQRNGTTVSPATIGDKVGIGMISPTANLQILTTGAGTISFGDASAFPNKSASTDGGVGLYNLPGSVTPAFKMGLFTEVTGQLLSYGINVSQIGDRDTTKTGAIFRMDTRATSPYFSVKRQTIGGSVEFSDIQISQAGDIGLGGWNSDVNSFPGNVSLLVRGVAVPGLVVQGASGQTADLTQWQSFGSLVGAAGPVLLAVNSNGALITPAATALTITSGTTGAVNIDSGTTGAINIGNNANAKAITIGNSTGATSLLLASGTGGVKIGTSSATPIINHFSATAALDFPSMTNSCSNLTITVTGAAIGDTAIATPDNTAGGAQTLTINWNAWVSAANTVTIRECDLTPTAQNPASQTWRADVWRH